MSLTKYRKPNYSPLSLFDDFFNSDFDSMFMPLSFYSNNPNANNVALLPKANVYYHDNKGCAIELAVPGFSRDDFNLDVENGVVTISLDGKVTDTQAEYENIRRREWSYSNFKRSFTLPEGTNIEQISAAYEAGVLKIDVPVTTETITKRIIQID